MLGTALLIGCIGRPIEEPGCDQPCEVVDQWPGVGECRDGSCTPTFFECFEEGEYNTCNEMCEAAGSACAENACADGTYLIHVVLDVCTDPTKKGIPVTHGCAEPIDWQFNTAARCCCEQP
ncbi:MAG: hypothetical protein HC927_08525 [Deltaproteobacteria bacterium]|nr:hypothetical protein [Deltaproteobacteria bacterium]